MLLCRTLGPVEVTIDGRSAPPELLWRRHLALLVYLARSPKRSRTRDHLVGILWPEKAESAARHSLREAVRILRRCVGDAGVETTGERIRLVGDTVQLDVDQLDACIARRAWADAAVLIAGDFLEGFAVPDAAAFEDWLAAERLTWRARSLDVLGRHAEDLLAAGDTLEAASVARRAAALDPLSDRPTRLAMRAAALAGDRATALRAFDEFARRIDEATGAGPEPETVALAARVRRERLPAPADAGRSAKGGASRRAPLIGRRDALAQLSTAWSRARDGHGAALLVIEGDPGLGKTRLLNEVRVRAALEGAMVAVVRLVEADRDEPFSALLGLADGGLVDASGVAGATAGAVRAVAARVPAWRDRFRDVAPDDSVPLGVAFRDILAAIVHEGPLLLAVDDAQWLDRESLLTMEAILRDLPTAPLSITVALAAYPRRAEQDALSARIGRDLEGVSVTLDPLTANDIRRLARWALPHYTDDEIERVSRRVLVDSAGLPLLAVELLHAIAVGLDLRGTEGTAWPEPFRTLDQTPPGDLPNAVVAAIRVGFRRLPRPTQHVLAALSVLGDRVVPATLAAVTDMPAEDVISALDELEWERWILADRGCYGFGARIVRDVVARDMLTRGQRDRLIAAAAATRAND